MSFIISLKNLFKKSPELATENDNENRFKNYINIIENNAFGYDKTKVAKYLIALIVDYLNNSEAIKALEYVESPQSNNYIEQIYKEIEYDLSLERKASKLDDPQSNDFVSIDVNSIPIILNPWKGERVVDNLMSIGENGNVFDGIAYKFNIQNHYLYPMNVVVCSGGNHSQFSARFKNEGITIIDTKYDFSSLYDKVCFNGNNYIRKKDNSILELKYDEELIFYSGIIFELGKYLLNSNDNRF